MPVPGPRNQFCPLPGYRNPGGERPTRWQHWLRPSAVSSPGRSPATMIRTVRGMVLAFGQIRRDWRQTVNYIPAQPGYSWTANAPQPSRPIVGGARGFQISRSLRYMTRSTYMGAGIDNSRYANLHTAIYPRNAGKTPTIGAGIRRGQPTIRNRLTSFGSRVPPLNAAVDASSES